TLGLRTELSIRAITEGRSSRSARFLSSRDAVMAMYEPQPSMATEPGQVAVGQAAVRQALAGFLAMKPPPDRCARLLTQPDKCCRRPSHPHPCPSRGAQAPRPNLAPFPLHSALTVCCAKRRFLAMIYVARHSCTVDPGTAFQLAARF